MCFMHTHINTHTHAKIFKHPKAHHIHRETYTHENRNTEIKNIFDEFD